jgi:two-component system sensor histidine kinase KdpD
MDTRSITGPWAAGECLLVCISPGQLAEKLVRTTRRLADELNAPWFAVYVEVAAHPELNPTNRERLGTLLLLAEEMGARTQVLSGHSVPEAVLSFARKNNVTKIVIGKPLRPRWHEWIRGSLVDQLIYASGRIDVYVINAQVDEAQVRIPEDWRPHQPLGRYLGGIGLVILATFLGYLVRDRLEPANLVML